MIASSNDAAVADVDVVDVQRQQPREQRLRLSYKVFRDDVGDDGGATLVEEHLDIIDAPNVQKLACFQRVQRALLLENMVAGGGVASAAMAEVESELLLLLVAVDAKWKLDLMLATVASH